MVFPEFESGAGRKPMKTMAWGGHRTRRILGAGGTLVACRQKEYLVRVPAHRGGIQRSVDVRKFFDRVCCVQAEV